MQLLKVGYPGWGGTRQGVGFLSELNNLLIKFYQTSPVLIDYNRLMQGEEGITNYFDIEVIKKNKKMKRREAFIDTIKMPKEA